MATLAAAAATSPTGEEALSSTAPSAVSATWMPTERTSAQARPSARARRSLPQWPGLLQVGPLRDRRTRPRRPCWRSQPARPLASGERVGALLDVEGVEEGHDQVCGVATGVEQHQAGRTSCNHCSAMGGCACPVTAIVLLPVITRITGVCPKEDGPCITPR